MAELFQVFLELLGGDFPGLELGLLLEDLAKVVSELGVELPDFLVALVLKDDVFDGGSGSIGGAMLFAALGGILLAGISGQLEEDVPVLGLAVGSELKYLGAAVIEGELLGIIGEGKLRVDDVGCLDYVEAAD